MCTRIKLIFQRLRFFNTKEQIPNNEIESYTMNPPANSICNRVWHDRTIIVVKFSCQLSWKKLEL